MESIAKAPKQGIYPFTWSNYTILAIGKAIMQAWDNLLINNSSVHSLDEKKINSLLHHELYTLWESGTLNYFNSNQFSSPGNSGNYISYDNSVIEANPDIVIELSAKNMGLAPIY